jgi:HEAT repeat protein
MNKLIGSVALISLASLWCVGAARAHGGTYAGPGDTVPPGGGGSTGGPAGPTTPNGPGGTPSGPNRPGPSTGGNPPGSPVTPGGGKTAPTTGGGMDTGADLTRWQFWWELNKERYLDLKHQLYARRVTTDPESLFLDPEGKVRLRDQMRPSLETIRDVVVPGLLDALAKDSSNDVVTGVLVALAKIGDVRDEGGRSAFGERMTPYLRDANQEIAETAALALGILGDEQNFEVLSALVHGDRNALRGLGVEFKSEVSDRTRAFAAYGLGLLGNRASEVVRTAIVAQLCDYLEHEGRSAHRRDVPVACVIALGLVPLADDASLAPVDLSKSVARPSKLTNRVEQVLWLRDLFRDGKVDPLLRAHVPRALAKLEADLPPTHWLHGAIAGTLLAALDEHAKEDLAVQQSCVLALGGVGDCDADELDTRIRTVLMRAHDSYPDQQLKRFALIALAQTSGRPGEASDDPIAALSAKRENPRAFLLDKLAKSSSAERCWAALALAVEERGLDDAAQRSSSDVRGALRLSLEQASAADEIGAFAIALGILRDDGAKDVLRAKFERVGDPDARGYVALALGMIGDVDSIATIEKVLAKSQYQPELLRQAGIALGLLGDQHVVDDLIDMLSRAAALSSQAAIASALGTIGDARSIRPLIALLGDAQKTSRARGFAAAALGIVSDKDEHPWLSRISLDINYRANTETLTDSAGTGVLEIL